MQLAFRSYLQQCFEKYSDKIILFVLEEMLQLVPPFPLRTLENCLKGCGKTFLLRKGRLSERRGYL